MIHVVNIKTHSTNSTGTTVYIGRSMPGRPGSPLGNPFKLRFESERAAVLAKYKAWLADQLSRDTAARQELERLAYIARDEDLVLACWCAPAICHGDVIKEEIERLLRRPAKEEQ